MIIVEDFGVNEDEDKNNSGGDYAQERASRSGGQSSSRDSAGNPNSLRTSTYYSPPRRTRLLTDIYILFVD